METSLHPSFEKGTRQGGDAAVDNIGNTVSRRIRTDDETNLGDAFALPEEASGIIPGAVEVADYDQEMAIRKVTYASSIPNISKARLLGCAAAIRNMTSLVSFIRLKFLRVSPDASGSTQIFLLTQESRFDTL